MANLTFSSLEYGGLFSQAFAAGLLKRGVPYDRDGGEIVIEKEECDIGAVSEAAAHAIVDALRPAEILRLMSLLPYPIRNDGAVFRFALKLSEKRPRFNEVEKNIKAYLIENDTFYAEGFLRFRLTDLIEDWAAAVDRAASEMISGMEYAELTRLICFAAGDPEAGRGGEANLILHKDGSFTLNGRDGFRAECADIKNGAIIATLVCLRPEKLTIYDFSEGNALGLVYTLLSVFDERTCVFIGNC